MDVDGLLHVYIGKHSPDVPEGLHGHLIVSFSDKNLRNPRIVYYRAPLESHGPANYLETGGYTYDEYMTKFHIQFDFVTVEYDPLHHTVRPLL